MTLTRKLKNWVVLNERRHNLVRFSQFYPMKQIRKSIRDRNMKNIYPLTVESKEPPKRIAIETTNYCNTSCKFCPHSRMQRKLEHMSRSLYDKVIKEVVELGTKEVSLGFIGEPLLDVHLFDRIKVAKELGMYVNVFTNGILLDEDKANKLLLSGIDDVFISVDAYNSNRYKEMRSTGKYEEVVKNAKYFINQKRQLLLKKPNINVGMILLDEKDRKHKHQFLKEWKEADNIHARTPHAWANRVSTLDMKEIRQLNLPCYSLWTHMAVLSNGTVVPCCMDIEGELKLGDVNKESLKDIWNKSKQLKALRTVHIGGKSNKIPLCEKCDVLESQTLPWWYFE